MDFHEKILRSRLSGKKIGGTIYFLPEVTSTNDYAFRLAAGGAPEGTVVIADRQTKGKGRMDRVWQSPPRANLYASVILKPPVEPAQAPQITLLAGVAVADALALYCPREVTLKWPNDVKIRGRKVCGILTEMKTMRGIIDFVVVGIGINVNVKRDELDDAFRNAASSLREEVGRELSRLDLTENLFAHLEDLYGKYIREGFGPIRDRWLSYADIMGKLMQVVFGDEIREGVAVGIDEDGALLLRDETGTVRRILAGDASVMKTMQ